MEQQKTRTYLLYAVGEIALVMIGILLALQVNNWNEGNRAKAEELILMQNLKADFETRYAELKEFTKVRNENFAVIEELTIMIAEPESILQPSEMHRRFATLNNLVLFNEQSKVLDVLFNTGKIDQISNRELKSRLLQWPQQVEEMMEEQRLRYDIYNSILSPLQYKYLNLRDIFEQFNFRGLAKPTRLPRTKAFDYQKILADPLFENYLAQLDILFRVNANDYLVLIESAERIIQLIENEIESES